MRTPTESEVITTHIDGRMTDVHVAVPGIVLAYNAAEQTADVTVATRIPLQTLSGDNVYDDPVTLPAVPVQWPSGGGYFAAFGLAPGDPVLVVFADIACGEYLETGDVSAPADTRRHSMGYCCAIPGGLRPKTRKLLDAPSVGVVIGEDGGDAQIGITAAGVSLGKGATDKVALNSLVKAAIADLVTWIKTGVAPSGGGTVTYATSAPTDDVGATLVKAK